MQKDETASCQGSVLNLGSVALSEVTQSMTDYVPISQHATVTNSSAFYDGLNYPSISEAMKRDALTAVQTSRDGNRGYIPQMGFSGANAAAVGREAYCNELFYSEDKSYTEGVDLTVPGLQGQDQMQQGKVVYTSGGRGLEGDVLEQNSNYFNVPLSELQLAIVSSKAMRNGQVAPNEKVAFVKERKTEGILKEGRDAKPIRILQRPSVHSEKRSDEEEVKMLDALTLMPQKRIHHRKKTLSLNPEEREALESLVEEVIIGGFEEDIASSDETASEDEDLNISKAVVERKRNMKDLKDRGDIGTRYADQIVLEKGTKPLQQQRDALDRKRNNFQKDFISKPVSKYGRKDQRKAKDNDHYNTKVKTDHRTIDSSLQQNKTVMLNSDKEKTDDRVQGLNIYPAQLKVAIKHMDSLPPRFLRRLQSGQNRLDLILPRHSEMASDDRGEQAASAESDKGRSKVLRETKKSIRNLLCDLDQYVDEGLTTPIMNESLSNLPFSLNPCDKSLDNSAFQSEGFSGALRQSSPPDRMKPLAYLNQQPPFASRLFPMSMDASGVLQVPCIGTNAVDAPYLGEKSGFLSKGVVYQCEEVEKLLKSGSDIAPPGVKALYDSGAEKKDFMQQNMEHFPGNGEGFDLCRQPSNAPISMKKSQFSVDAPEFVSAFFKTNRTSSDAGSVFQPGLYNPLHHGNGSGLSQPGLQVPVYVASEVEGIAQQDALTREVLPGTPSSEDMSRVKFLGMPGMPESMASFQAVPFVPASTLASSAYLDRAPLSELFASHVPCPLPPPPHPSHAVIGMMHYQPYQFSPCVSGYGHPEFALDRSNFLIPAVPPNWMNEMQSPNGLPVTAMGWCPPGQAPFASCSLGQQLPEKVPMLLCNPGPFVQDSAGGYAAWNWQNTCSDPDTLYQRVSDLLNDGEFVLVILIGVATSDLSTITSQWQGITDDVVFMSTDGSILDANNSPVLSLESTDSSSLAVPYSGPEKHDVISLSNCSSTEMEFKLKQVFQGKRRLIILDHTYAAQPWEIHSYVALAQGLGYQVEVVDLSENGPYPGSEATGSFMFEGDYNSSLIYPPSAPNSEFLPGATLPLYQHLKV